ncbi:unnamed protein product [Umbelopsis sp. WA50703]
MDDFEEQLSPRKVSDSRLRDRGESRICFVPRTGHSLYFLALAAVEAIIIISLEATVFGIFFGTKFNSPDQLGQAIDAVRAQNTIQIIGIVLFNLCCFIYSIFQFRQINDSIQVPPTSPDAATSAWLETAFKKLYQEFGWRIYKKIGADPEIRNMYRWYQIFLMLLKLDIFFFLGFSIQFLVLVLHSGDVEYPLTIIALPLTCLFLLLAVYAVKHESRQLIIIFFIGTAAAVAYFVFKIYRIYDPSQAGKYLYTKDFLTFFASVSLTLLILTITNGIICWMNFDKGLKAHLLRDAPTLEYSNTAGDRTMTLD